MSVSMLLFFRVLLLPHFHFIAHPIVHEGCECGECLRVDGRDLNQALQVAGRKTNSTWGHSCTEGH